MEKTQIKFLTALLIIVFAIPILSFKIPQAEFSKAAAKPKLAKKRTILEVGDKEKIKLKNKPSKAEVRYKSKNSRVASVNSKGKVTAKSSGKTVIKITVKTPGYKKKLSFKVKVLKDYADTDDYDDGNETGSKNKSNNKNTTSNSTVVTQSDKNKVSVTAVPEVKVTTSSSMSERLITSPPIPTEKTAFTSEKPSSTPLTGKEEIAASSSVPVPAATPEYHKGTFFAYEDSYEVKQEIDEQHTTYPDSVKQTLEKHNNGFNGAVGSLSIEISDDGTERPFILFLTDGSIEWAKENFDFDVKDVSNKLCRQIRERAGLSTELSCADVEYTAYEDPGGNQPDLRTEIKMYLNVGNGINMVKVFRKSGGIIYDCPFYSDDTIETMRESTVWYFANISCLMYSYEADSYFRHKIEEKIWTPDMDKSSKLSAAANYINNYLHYSCLLAYTSESNEFYGLPYNRYFSKEDNPDLWDIYNIDNKFIYAKKIRWLSGFADCRTGADMLTGVAIDLGIKPLQSIDERGEKEGYYIYIMPNEISSSHYCFGYSIGQGEDYLIEAQGNTPYGTCTDKEKEYRQYIVNGIDKDWTDVLKEYSTEAE